MHITEEIEQLFLDRRYGEVVELSKNMGQEHIDSFGMDIVSTLITVGLRTAHSPEELQSSLRSLRQIVTKMNPKEALTALLENWISSDKQYLLLEPIEIALQAVQPKTWHRQVESVISAISRKLGATKLPEELQQKTRIRDPKKLSILEDTTLNETILVPIEAYAHFAKSCWGMLEARRPEMDQNAIAICSDMLKEFVLRLVGYPLALCPFDAPSCSDDNPRNAVMQDRRLDQVKLVDTRAGTLAKTIKSVGRDLGVTMQLVLESLDAGSDEESTQASVPSVVSYLYASLEDRNNSCGTLPLPSPVSPKSAFIRSATLVSKLADEDCVELHVKSLTICLSLLQNVNNRADYLLLDDEYLQSSVHSDFFPKLCNILTFSEDPGVRKLGSALFELYLWSFNATGRLTVMTEILNSPFQDTVIGYSITQLKDFVNQALSQKNGSTTCLRLRQEESILPGMSICFLGTNLKTLFVACIRRSRKGDKLDIMEQHSTIVSTLNFLRFLSIRDGNKNISGVLDWEAAVTPFFEVVRSSLEICKLRVRADMEAAKNDAGPSVGNSSGSSELRIVDRHGAEFGNEEEMTKDETIKSCNITLCNLDIVEGLLVRTSQCYEASLKYKPC